VDGYKASVKNLETPVSLNASHFLMKTYLWTSVCMFGFTVANFVVGYGIFFLHDFVHAIFDTWMAMLLAYVALPAFVFMNLRKIQMTETEREQVVLFGSVDEGALVGALFSNRFTTIFTPPLFLLPLIMGLVAHYAGSKEQVAGNRQVFLGALVGGAMAGYLVFGFLFNFTFHYILSMVILSAAAAADLQLKVASIQRGDSSPQLEQWKTVVILTIASVVARFLISANKERAAEILKQEVSPK